MRGREFLAKQNENPNAVVKTLSDMGLFGEKNTATPEVLTRGKKIPSQEMPIIRSKL